MCFSASSEQALSFSKWQVTARAGSSSRFTKSWYHHIQETCSNQFKFHQNDHDDFFRARLEYDHNLSEISLWMYHDFLLDYAGGNRERVRHRQPWPDGNFQSHLTLQPLPAAAPIIWEDCFLSQQAWVTGENMNHSSLTWFIRYKYSVSKTGIIFVTLIDRDLYTCIQFNINHKMKLNTAWWITDCKLEFEKKHATYEELVYRKDN